MKLHKTEQAYLCPYWGADFGELVSFWTPESRREEPYKSLNHEKSFIWISCLIGCQNQASINLQKMWVLSSGLMEWHHSLTLSQGPVSAEDLPFTFSRPILFSQSRCTVRNSVSSLRDQRVETNKEKVHKGTEKRSLLPHLHLGCCLVLCSGWIPPISAESLVLACVLLVLCVFLLWNIYLRERWKSSEIGVPWTPQYPWGMDHICFALKDLACFLELCGKCTEGCLINIMHLYAVSYVEKKH